MALRGWRLFGVAGTIFAYVAGILLLSIVSLNNPNPRRVRYGRYAEVGLFNMALLHKFNSSFRSIHPTFLSFLFISSTINSFMFCHRCRLPIINRYQITILYVLYAKNTHIHVSFSLFIINFQFIVIRSVQTA